MPSPSPSPALAPSLAAAALCAAVLLVALPPARGINCYQCNSKVDAACAELANGTERFLRPCKDGPDGEPAFCRRSLIKVLAANKGEGETRIVRSCGWVEHKSECYQFDDDDHHEHVCQCFTDACNTAPGAGPAHFLAALLAPALALALARRR